MYWEKTVEYAFVLDLFRHGRLKLAAPLGGKHERALGDAIFALDDLRLVLVEFKRSEAGRHAPEERAKFVDFERAKAELAPRDACHWIVWGQLGDSELELQGCRYFDLSSRVEWRSEGFKQSVDAQAFRTYMSGLMAHRKPDARGGETSSDGTGGAGASCVFAVDEQGNVVGTMTVNEILQELGMAAPSRSQSPGPQPRRTSMRR